MIETLIILFLIYLFIIGFNITIFMEFKDDFYFMSDITMKNTFTKILFLYVIPAWLLLLMGIWMCVLVLLGLLIGSLGSIYFIPKSIYELYIFLKKEKTDENY